MKHPLTLLVAYGLATAQAAATDLLPGLPADSSRVIDIEEVVVAATPKEHVRLRRQPLASTLLGREALSRRGIADVKGASSYVPNFFMPD